MRRIGILTLVGLMLLVLAGCGGSDDSSDGDSATSTSSGGGQSDDQGSGDDDQATTSSVSVDDAFDTDGGTGTITIGDETWELELVEAVPIAACDANFFGGFVAILVNPGADMSSPMDLLNVMLPGGDFTDPPSVELNLAASGGDEWVADETIYEQNSELPAGLGVTDFSIDGNTASGSATFFEQESYYQFNAGNGDLIVADGTFTVTCAGE